ncbi:hypothetical protein CONPUDRAFT_68659 [Coniophora puteana RWD-64-598 SS2]|uniref:SUN domain-containing protein n=1 Tax=Coniophora puteana (strain RWD-64-598) TaxID=741705 RepID=A0A5M3N551_CONPW|nr:uncharacterized protein CONPUDRAFT_68659 [Coniophora puteana RWD-64-598 SS2]EIW86041.1 hypothetical protein CONPUDRAFT_68659 [Coniophora puteana RWD-64-598 SS2]
MTSQKNGVDPQGHSTDMLKDDSFTTLARASNNRKKAEQLSNELEDEEITRLFTPSTKRQISFGGAAAIALLTAMLAPWFFIPSYSLHDSPLSLGSLSDAFASHMFNFAPRFSALEEALESLELQVSHLETHCISTSSVDKHVRQALDRHSLAYLGRRDYALASHGGRINYDLTSQPSRTTLWHIPLLSSPQPTPSPELAIDADNDLGSCWLLEATSGQLGITLAQRLKVSHITLEHVPRQVSDMRLAPRQLLIWGMVDDESAIHRIQEASINYPSSLTNQLQTNPSPRISASQIFVPLVLIEYDILSDDLIQSFSVIEDFTLLDVAFETMVVDILDNYGGEETCLYRVRIHGEEA